MGVLMKVGYERIRREDMGKTEPKTSQCCCSNDSNVSHQKPINAVSVIKYLNRQPERGKWRCSPRLPQLRGITHAMRSGRSLNENTMLESNSKSHSSSTRGLQPTASEDHHPSRAFQHAFSQHAPFNRSASGMKGATWLRPAPGNTHPRKPRGDLRGDRVVIPP